MSQIRFISSFISALIFIVVITVAPACNGSTDDTATGSDKFGSGVTGAVSIVDQDVYLNPDNFLQIIVELKTDAPARGYVDYTVGPGDGRRTNGVEITTGSTYLINVLGLPPQTPITVTPLVVGNAGVRTYGKAATVTTGVWPENWPRPQVIDNTPAGTFDPREVICFDRMRPGKENMYMCADRAGTPVWYAIHPENFWMHMLRALSDGTFVVNCEFSAHIYFLDTTGSELASYSTDYFASRTQYEHHAVHHDIIEITEGPWAGAVAFLTNSVREVTHPAAETPPDPESNDYFNFPYDLQQTVTEPMVADGIIVFDYKSKRVLWDYNFHGKPNDPRDPDDSRSSDEKLPYTRRGLGGTEGGDIAVDWLHSNALLHSYENGTNYFWISMRNQDWIVKLDADDKKIIWRLGYRGDFDLYDSLEGNTLLPDYKWFFRQHAPEWQSHGDGVYDFILFDNGSTRLLLSDYPSDPSQSPDYSRVARFVIDENTMKAALTWEYGSPNPENPDHFFGWAVGDADMLPSGNIMFDKGWQSEDFPWVGEITYPEGELLWKMTMDAPEEVYRANWFPSIYNTTWWYSVER